MDPSPSSIAARYVHTNLIARDWRVLARFYRDVFGCEVVRLALPTGEPVEWCYVADPEGNGIEFQTWF